MDGKVDTSKKKASVTQKHETTHYVYSRNPEISTYAKRRAAGFCDLCGNAASFNDRNGHPYMESHHIEWLSNGGADIIDNVVALCPNCHRKMHIVNDSLDVDHLLERIEAYSSAGK